MDDDVWYNTFKEIDKSGFGEVGMLETDAYKRISINALCSSVSQTVITACILWESGREMLNANLHSTR